MGPLIVGCRESRLFPPCPKPQAVDGEKGANFEHEFGSFPLGSAVQAFRARSAQSQSSVANYSSDQRYLSLAAGICRAFAGRLTERGAIIDPYEQKEIQYATAAFACAASTISRYDSADNDLFQSAVRSTSYAIRELASGRIPDFHEDFCTVLLMRAYENLADLVSAEQRHEWRRLLSFIVPSLTYRQQPWLQNCGNWNVVAVAGEWSRYKSDLIPSIDWVEYSLQGQVDRFNDFGMYRESGMPLAYDLFARFHILDLLRNGYNGRQQCLLAQLSERGAWTSLFMQSPQGDSPTGGRSSQHVWIEAQQTALFEYYASVYFARGDAIAAGAFKRAARLSLESIGRWVRPCGDLWIVKNRADPVLRHGYETYSSHSSYNLLTAAMLCAAHSYADENIAEGVCPADVGGFVFYLKAFHKIFANCGGLYLEIDVAGDGKYNPTGLLRLHRSGLVGSSLPDGLSKAPAYQLPGGDRRSVAFVPEWRDQSGQWHSLADHRCPPDVKITRQDSDVVEFEIAYSNLAAQASLRQAFILRPQELTVTSTIDGPVDKIRQCIPLLLNDGRDETRIELTATSVTVTELSNGCGIAFHVQDSSPIERLGLSLPCRNGFLDVAYAETGKTSQTCRLELVRTQ